MKKKRKPLQPPQTNSERLYIRLTPPNTRIFRYLLEGYEGVAYTSIVERKTSVVKIKYSKDQEKDVQETLEEIRTIVDFDYIPFDSIKDQF